MPPKNLGNVTTPQLASLHELASSWAHINYKTREKRQRTNGTYFTCPRGGGGGVVCELFEPRKTQRAQRKHNNSISAKERACLTQLHLGDLQLVHNFVAQASRAYSRKSLRQLMLSMVAELRNLAALFGTS